MTGYSSLNPARRGYASELVAGADDIAPTNVILDLARDYDSGDPWGESCELLYALHRLWGDYQSPTMGTSPIDAFDAGDDCALYTELSAMLSELPADEAARQIAHATKVADRWNTATKLAGRDY